MKNNNLARFEKLKKQVSKLQREADKAQGSLDEIMKRLKQDFSCTSIEDARRLLEKLRAQEARSSRVLRKKLQRFERKWRDVL